MTGTNGTNGNGDGILRFETNLPVEVALAYPDGKLVEGRYGDQMLYTLTDGRRMYVHPLVAKRITDLGIGQEESFEICKRQVKNGNRKGIEWQVTRLEAEPPVAFAPQPVSRPAAAPSAATKTATATQSASNGKANGTTPQLNAGTVVASAMAGALLASIDALLLARDYALKSGWKVEFNEEDIRAIGSTIYIQLSKTAVGGGTWQH